MSNATAKITRQSTGPEMTDYLDNEIYNLCESIQDNGQALKSGGLAVIKFIELFKVGDDEWRWLRWLCLVRCRRTTLQKLLSRLFVEPSDQRAF